MGCDRRTHQSNTWIRQLTINLSDDVTYLYREAADRFRALGLFGLGSPAMLMSGGEDKRKRIKNIRI